MEASESSVVETPTEPVSAPVESLVAPEVSVEQPPVAPVTTEAPSAPEDPPAPFPAPETPSTESPPEPEASPVTPGRIELSTGKQHDIQDIRSLQGLSVQAGGEFTELIRADGKPIWVAADQVVSYE